MAPKIQMPVPTEDRDVENSSSEDDSPWVARLGGHRRLGLLALAAVGALGFAGLAAGSRKHTARAAGSRKHTARGHEPGAARSLTVRDLLASDELAEVATRNLVTMGGVQRADGMPMEHGELKGKVLDSFKNIHAFISEHDPESARQLEALPVTEDERRAALDRLSYYCNPLVLKLTKEITAAYNKHHGQMHEEMATTVLAHTGDLESIAQALFPVDRAGGEPVGMPLSVDTVQRRLASKVDTVSGVMPQARTLLEGLEVGLGDKMPKAPSRLLFDLNAAMAATTFPTSSSLFGSTPTSPTTPGVPQPGLMACMEKAVPNPVEVASCLATKSKTVVASMKNFIAKSKSAVGMAPSNPGTSGTSLFSR